MTFIRLHFQGVRSVNILIKLKLNSFLVGTVLFRAILSYCFIIFFKSSHPSLNEQNKKSSDYIILYILYRYVAVIWQIR